MNTEITIKVKVLDVYKDSFEGVPLNERIITFKDSTGTILAEIPFTELELSQSSDFYYFVTSGINNKTLRGDIISTGVVALFEIEGLDDSVVPVKKVIVTGTVGTLSSNADLKCNRTNWSQGRIVTWNNLSIKVV